MAKTEIQWTHSVLNPVTGCSKVSAGCKNCYAERMAMRLKAMGVKKYADGFSVRCHRDQLSVLSGWRKPRMVFVNSMGDLFHDEVPASFISEVFDAMNVASQHTFQILTKREDRLVELADKLNWGPNIWMGVSVENQDNAHRLDALRKVPAALRFVSFEPLIGAVDRNVDLDGIGWAIVGGESGHGARPMDPDWARALRDACLDQNVPFFFKQWGGTQKAAGAELDGRQWREMPSLQFTNPSEAA